MTFLKFLGLIFFIGITGWSVRYFFLSTKQKSDDEKFREIASLLKEFFLIFLTGFGTSSVLIFVLAITGFFEIKIIFILFSVSPAICFAKYLLAKEKGKPLRLGLYLLFCALLGLTSFSLGKFARPFEAVIHADDASIYIGTAFQLARSGSLSYQDRLVIEMTQQERNQILNNRFSADMTGDKIRFPGGVRLLNSSNGKVGFSFYHLFPVWLGLGIQTLGEYGFLNVMSLFLAIMLISLFLLGRLLGGLILGISVPLVCFFFYPQLYFSLMPASELLTGTLFLSGLWVFLSGLRFKTVLTSNQQSIVGVIWGALFLCRLESLVMVCLSLTFLFSTIPAFAKNWPQYRILILHLVFFLFMALYYQIIRGEYFYVLTSTHFLRNQTMVLLGIEILNFAIMFTQNNPFQGLLAFLILTAMTLGCLMWLFLNDNAPNRLRLKIVIGILFISIFLASLLTSSISWSRIVKHLSWLSVYFSSPILITLFLGTILFVFRIINNRSSTHLVVLFIMLLFPAIIYLVRPLVMIEQPWGTRKFVPMLFPLFFVISLAGWFHYLKAIMVRRRFVPSAAFCVLVSLLTTSFFGRSQYLLSDALFTNVISQTQNLASTISEDGLIVIPESWAAMHLQIPLQYSAGRDTLLLPVDKIWNKKLLLAMTSFLNRQLERRPVVVLLKSCEDPPPLLRKSFKLKPVYRNLLSFRNVPRSRKLEFPDRAETASLDYTVFELVNKADPDLNEFTITYDDPNTTFVNFHDKEVGFRWTQEKSVVKDFAFQTDKSNTTVILSTLPGHSYYEMDNQEIRLLINDRIPATLLVRKNTDFYFDIDETLVSEITSVTILSKTFVPIEKRVNSDPRRLGLCFTKLTLWKGTNDFELAGKIKGYKNPEDTESSKFDSIEKGGL